MDDKELTITATATSDCVIGACYKFGVRDTMQGVVRCGRNMFLPVLLGARSRRSKTIDNTKVIRSIWFSRYTIIKLIQRGKERCL